MPNKDRVSFPISHRGQKPKKKPMSEKERELRRKALLSNKKRKK